MMDHSHDHKVLAAVLFFSTCMNGCTEQEQEAAAGSSIRHLNTESIQEHVSLPGVKWPTEHCTAVG